MREILFRGKRMGINEWVEGGIVHQTDFYGESVDRYFIIDGTDTDDDIGPAYRVYPDSIGQYTGLTDKNGKKIFEGDILEDTWGNETYRDVVVANRWNCSCCDGVYGYAFEHHEERLDFRDIKSCAVVGNIHDNPELLEVGK